MKHVNLARKRKLRQLLYTRILPIGGIFLGTLVILFVVSLIFWNHQTLQTPLGKVYTQALKSVGIQPDASKTIEHTLQQQQIAYNTISSDEKTYHILLKDDQAIVLSKQKNLEAQLASLQLIISRLTIEGRRWSRIDFRFDNPVITF